MEDFSKRRAKSQVLLRFLLRGGGVLLLGFVAVTMVRASYNMYGKFTEAAEAQQGAQDRLTLLVAQKEQVGAAVEAFDSPRGIEAEVRERYGVARPGEGRIEIVRETPTTSLRTLQGNNLLVRIFEALWPF